MAAGAIAPQSKSRTIPQFRCDESRKSKTRLWLLPVVFGLGFRDEGFVFHFRGHCVRRGSGEFSYKTSSDGLRVSQFAFPNDDHLPTSFLEDGLGCLVALNVAFEFREPVLTIGFWSGGPFAALMSMPEAAVYENDCLELGHDDVGFAGKSFVFRSVNGKAIAETMQKAPGRSFRSGVFSSNTAHNLGTS